jgi:nitrate reductase delta subunit
MLRVAGFEESGDELPDFLPLLLEFLAHAPADMPADAVTALEQRIAAVCVRIQGHLDADNLYYDVFGALRDVFQSSVEADPDKRFSGREQADTGEMPYPLHYD